MNLHSPSEPSLSLRARQKEATRDAILAAAADVFADGAAARMEDVAARAGVAVGTVYNHFADRAALVGELLEARSRVLLEALDGGPPVVRSQEATEQFEAALTHFVTALARHFDENRGLLSVLVQEEAARGLDVRQANRRRTLLEEILVRTEALVARGLKARAFRRADPEIHGALLVGMVRGLALSALTGRAIDPATGAREVVRVFLRGVSR